MPITFLGSLRPLTTLEKATVTLSLTLPGGSDLPEAAKEAL